MSSNASLHGDRAAETDAGDSDAEDKRQVSIVPDLGEDSLRFAADPALLNWDQVTYGGRASSDPHV